MVDWLDRVISFLDDIVFMHRRYGNECYSCNSIAPCLTAMKAEKAILILKTMKEEWEKGGAKTGSSD